MRDGLAELLGERADPSCAVCGSADCVAFTPEHVHERYPFMSDADKQAAIEAQNPKPKPVKRPRGKRAKHGPAEDRAKRASEDR